MYGYIMQEVEGIIKDWEGYSRLADLGIDMSYEFGIIDGKLTNMYYMAGELWKRAIITACEYDVLIDVIEVARKTAFE